MSTLFAFRVTGVEFHPRSTLTRPFEQDGEISVEPGEGMGDALNRLVHQEMEWDMLDAEHPVTIELRPAATP